MPFFVDVITTKRDDPSIITDRRTIDYDRSKSRAWLGKHSNWAMRNGFAVHTAADHTVRIRDLIPPHRVARSINDPDHAAAQRAWRAGDRIDSASGRIDGPCSITATGNLVMLHFTSEHLALDFFNRHHVRSAPSTGDAI